MKAHMLVLVSVDGTPCYFPLFGRACFDREKLVGQMSAHDPVPGKPGFWSRKTEMGVCVHTIQEFEIQP